jgi:hypothetical protein
MLGSRFYIALHCSAYSNHKCLFFSRWICVSSSLKGCYKRIIVYLSVIPLLCMANFLDKLTNSISRLTHGTKTTSDLSENIIYCRFCGRKNPENQVSCKVCKNMIDIQPSEVLKVCEKCNSAINYEDVFCFSCGTAIF